jgi:hypothetical protein
MRPPVTAASADALGHGHYDRTCDIGCILQLLAWPIHSRDVADGAFPTTVTRTSRCVAPRRTCPTLLNLPIELGQPRGVMQLTPRRRPSHPPPHMCACRPSLSADPGAVRVPDQCPYVGRRPGRSSGCDTTPSSFVGCSKEGLRRRPVTDRALCERRREADPNDLRRF